MGDVAVVDDVATRFASASVAAEFCSTSTMVYPGLGQLAADVHEIQDDNRSKPLERLVKQDDLRSADESARNREHLLFAAERSCRG